MQNNSAKAQMTPDWLEACSDWTCDVILTGEKRVPAKHSDLDVHVCASQLLNR